jgi:predicted negative regulator of RcsB-dependent stress response
VTDQDKRSDGETSEPEQEANLALTESDDSLVGAAEADGEPKNRRGRRVAASQARKQRLRERKEAEAVGLDAQEMIDDALVRGTSTTKKWLQKNSTILQGVAVAAVVVWAGWGIYGWRLKAAEAEASATVATAVAAERGRVGEPTLDDDNDPRPLYKDDAARIAASKTAFELAAKAREGKGTSVYSQLALAAVLLDEGKPDEARAAFEALENHKLAASDPELRGRAIEGVALSWDAKGDNDAALKAYSKLESTEIAGFVELAIYRQARLRQALKQDDQAKSLAEKLNAKLKESAPGPGSYLAQLARGLSEELGIASAEPPAPRQITPQQLEELQRAMQENMRKVAQKKPPVPGEQPPGEQPPGEQPPGEQPPGEQPAQPVKDPK